MSKPSPRTVKGWDQTYADRAGKLRALGLIPSGKIDLRKKLSPSQKRYITNTYNKFSSLVNSPYSFQQLSVSKSTTREIGDLASFVIPGTKKDRIFISKKPDQTVRLTRNALVIESKTLIERVERRARLGDEKSVRRIFRDLRKDEFVMLRVGTKSPMSMTFTDLNSLIKKMMEYIKSDSKKNEWLGNISVMKIKGDPEQVAAHKRPKKWVRKDNRRK